MAENSVRVLLLKGAESVRMAGGGLLVSDDTGQGVSVAFPALFKRQGDKLSVAGRSFRSLRLASPGLLQVNGKGYRGIIEITATERGLQVVNELPLEDYLVGLINCEISSQWPIETIKAQAVIARSYAMYQIKSRKSAAYHLESSVLDQVYDGSDSEDSRAAHGVRETAGKVLAYDGKIIQAFYHANCGGHTEASENVWGNPFPYLRGVECSYCAGSGSTRWEYAVGIGRLESVLENGGIRISGLKGLRPGRRNDSGRLAEVFLATSKGTIPVSAANFRRIVGYTNIKSTNFDIRMSGNEVFFSGTGYGHGVGLCQWGAKQRGEDGFSYDEILAYYYPGTKLLDTAAVEQ